LSRPRALRRCAKALPLSQSIAGLTSRTFLPRVALREGPASARAAWTAAATSSQRSGSTLR
jgi:hypothetical protein